MVGRRRFYDKSASFCQIVSTDPAVSILILQFLSVSSDTRTAVNNAGRPEYDRFYTERVVELAAHFFLESFADPVQGAFNARRICPREDPFRMNSQVRADVNNPLNISPVHRFKNVSQTLQVDEKRCRVVFDGDGCVIRKVNGQMNDGIHPFSRLVTDIEIHNVTVTHIFALPFIFEFIPLSPGFGRVDGGSEGMFSFQLR